MGKVSEKYIPVLTTTRDYMLCYVYVICLKIMLFLCYVKLIMFFPHIRIYSNILTCENIQIYLNIFEYMCLGKSHIAHIFEYICNM